MICLVGDILTDVTLASGKDPLKMRLGGIVHAARALWAMEVEYAVAYFAPSYMDSHINMFLKEHDCKAIIKLGTVINCPYTMLIAEAKEVGKQGYEFLYHDDIEIEYDYNGINQLNGFDEYMFISGNYDMQEVIDEIKENSRVSCDVANNVKSIEDLPVGRQYESLFISTSSDVFKNQYKDYDSFCELLKPKAKRIVLKENRGGSRVYDTTTGTKWQIPSQTAPIKHSVGVGDVYDVVSLAAPYANYEEKLYFASWVAMEYAQTTFPDDFKKAVKRLQKSSIESLMALPGCILPWEVRQNCHIYIAAPDFDFVDTKCVDIVCDSLNYHNFVPHRPIKENGQMRNNADKLERARLFSADMTLLNKCNMLLAVLLNNDPGTLIEIGMAVQSGMPAIIYDPYDIADNCMLTECPTFVSNDLDAVISKIFIEYSKQYSNETF